MAKVFLARPDVRYKESVIAGFRDAHDADGTPPPWHYEMLESHFEEYVNTVLSAETDPAAGLVPESHFWLIVDGDFAGRCSVRHYLTEPLSRYGGHIGYDISPRFRRKGYGIRQCALAIHEAHKLGIDRILITCDDTNIGSYKIIEANGGILQDKIDNGRLRDGQPVLTRRYWVE